VNFVFIVNPTSGNSRSLKVIEAIKEFCKLIKANYKVIYTKNVNDATKIAEFYKKYEDYTIFSVGGDGTLNEVVNGMVNSKAKLGVIPSGTGNDFYKTFKDIKEEKIDLGKVNDRYFINVASIGFDADIACYANELKKGKLSSKSVYILSIIHEFFSFKPIDINLEGKEKSSTILTICNAKYYGNGFKIAPKAILNDGLFDVIDIKSLNKFQIINLIIKLANAKHLNSKNVDFYRAASLNIDSKLLLNCNIDGEIIKDNSFKFSIERECLGIDKENSNRITNFLKVKKLIK